MPEYHPAILHWLAATRIPGIGPVKFRRLKTACPDIKELIATLQPQPDWASLERELNWCEKNAIHILTEEDTHYPPLLRELPDSPLVLYARGDTSMLSHAQLAMVGSRNPTRIGRDLAEYFAASLSRAGLVITSGLALGIDAASHQSALSAEGKTIAVLGTGLNHIYPRSNLKLAAKIIEHGVLVSEFPPNTAPVAKNFPQRNRVISGLSVGVLVVEAALRSGSLITARFAAEQGREVFAIPGSIHNPLARGCHALIRQGAKLDEKVEDILEELGALTAVTTPIQSTAWQSQLPSNYLNLLKQIDYEVTGIESIIHQSGLTAGEVSSILLALELQGYVYVVPGGYVRKPP